MLRVAHVGLQVPDLDASVAFAERILGLRVSERDGDTVFLTCNERHHELSLHAGAASALDHVAFEVDRERFAEIESRVDVVEWSPSAVPMITSEKAVKDANMAWSRLVPITTTPSGSCV